ncbi:hypothetical protein [Streptomyces kanamyceticus]|uniref:hypothetical protein n=1 Tax=Streptomyces kanamyceticus TaxID=1967 RepID=UPI0037DC691F
MNSQDLRAVTWTAAAEDGAPCLSLIDQTALPHATGTARWHDGDALIDAVVRLVVRGARS